MPRRRHDDWPLGAPSTLLRLPRKSAGSGRLLTPDQAHLAYLIDEGPVSTMFLRGFDKAELDEVRGAVRMTWEPDERAWRFRTNDRPTVVAILQELAFTVRLLVEVEE